MKYTISLTKIIQSSESKSITTQHFHNTLYVPFIATWVTTSVIAAGCLFLEVTQHQLAFEEAVAGITQA